MANHKGGGWAAGIAGRGRGKGKTLGRGGKTRLFPMKRKYERAMIGQLSKIT